MKKITLYFVLTTFFILNTSCSSDNSSGTSSSSIANHIKQGSWHVTSYVSNDIDETSHFSGYNFTFESGNILAATNGTNNYTGTWSIASNNSSDDSPEIDYDFNILFSSPANFADLTDDWEIVSQTSTRLELQDVSGGNGGSDYLTFQKN